jgi:hypothetical protein
MRLTRMLLAAMLVVLLVPALAHAKRLEVFENINGELYRKWSDDNGVTWSNGTHVGIWARFRCPNLIYAPQSDYKVIGSPAVISDQVGRFWVVVQTRAGILETLFTAAGDRGWCEVTGGRHLRANPDSSPTLASWGPGRLDLFTHTTNLTTGTIQLLHTWAENGVWTGNWEVLGTGLMSGSPAAVSWGYRRIDVFSRGGGGDLAHKWFDNGHWSGWESLGGIITSSPVVASTGSRKLNVFARGTDGALWHTYFDTLYWYSWEYLGGYLSGGSVPAQSAALGAGSREPGKVDVLVIGGDDRTGYQRSYDQWWQDFRNIGPLARNFGMGYWELIAPPPEDPSCWPYPVCP